MNLQGIFDITTLSCSPPEGSDIGIGALYLSMARQDLSVHAGEVTGALIAASPVQVPPFLRSTRTPIYVVPPLHLFIQIEFPVCRL